MLKSLSSSVQRVERCTAYPFSFITIAFTYSLWFYRTRRVYQVVTVQNRARSSSIMYASLPWEGRATEEKLEIKTQSNSVPPSLCVSGGSPRHPSQSTKGEVSGMTLKDPGGLRVMIPRQT